jgi:hypothetical protein
VSKEFVKFSGTEETMTMAGENSASAENVPKQRRGCVRWGLMWFAVGFVGSVLVCGGTLLLVNQRESSPEFIAGRTASQEARAQNVAAAGTAAADITLTALAPTLTPSDTAEPTATQTATPTRTTAPTRTLSPQQAMTATAYAAFQAVIANVEGVRRVNLAAIVGGDIVALEACVDDGLVSEAYAETLRDVAIAYVDSTPLSEFSVILDEGVQPVSYLWRPSEGWSLVEMSAGTACG